MWFLTCRVGKCWHLCPSVNGCRIFGIGRGRNQFEKTDWAIRRDFERCRPRVGQKYAICCTSCPKSGEKSAEKSFRTQILSDFWAINTKNDLYRPNPYTTTQNYTNSSKKLPTEFLPAVISSSICKTSCGIKPIL